jgi:DNA repair photolyase
MQITEREAKSILTEQTVGFLSDGEFPFTHALSPYTGCMFGNTTCGLYCYAAHLPSWTWRPQHMKPFRWGDAVEIKANAAALLAADLGKLTSTKRQLLRIFMSSSTDPYQPLEKEHQITRQLLRVFTQYKDLDLLVVQTRSPLAERDLALMANIPYLWLSITIETDDQDSLVRLKGGPPIAKRLALARKAVAMGINVQITVSPCLPYSSSHDFTQTLLNTGAQRFVVDTFKSGDGSNGGRTSRSGYARVTPDWENEDAASALYEALISAEVDVGWSVEGFCGIPYRNALAHTAAEAKQAAMFDMAVGKPVELEATDQIVLHFGRPGEIEKRLRGYSYFWIKYVTGFDPRYHCAAGLKCAPNLKDNGYHWPNGTHQFTPSKHILNKHPFEYIYMCGVARTRWADNLHIPMVHAPGEMIEDVTYLGVPILIQNARRLEIPWIEDGWNNFPQSFTTCRNWQFGIKYYGYNGERPAQSDFVRHNPERSQEALARAKTPAIKKPAKKKGKRKP